MYFFVMTHMDGILCNVKLHFERKSAKCLLYIRHKVTSVTSAKHEINLRLWFSGDQNFMIWIRFPHIKDKMLTSYQIARMVFHSTC